MASLWKHPKSENWMARYRGAAGKTVNRSTGITDKEEALRIALSWETEAAREREKLSAPEVSPGGISDAVARAERLARLGRLDAHAARDLINDLLSASGQETLDAITNQKWCDTWQAAKRGEVKERSMLKYKQVTRDWLDFLKTKAGKPLEAVGKPEAVSFREKLVGDRLAARTVNQTVKLLRGIYQDAVEEGHIGRNPFAGLAALKPNEGDSTRKPFTPDEIATLINAAEGDWQGMIILSATTGLRLMDASRLQNLDGFENKDALLNETFRKKPKDLKAAQAEEHGGQEELFKVYTERAWPACDVIVGNPPFLGDKLMRRELGDGYVTELRGIFKNRLPGQADLCCYWFEKARQQIEEGNCKRAGLLATQGIRGGANREVLKRIKANGEIFFAESDRHWVLAGASVHVSMVGFDGGEEATHRLNGKDVVTIHADLSSEAEVHCASVLQQNSGICFIGTTKKAPLDISEGEAVSFLNEPNVASSPNSSVVLPWMNGLHVTRRATRTWIIDFPLTMTFEEVQRFDGPFRYVTEHVKPLRTGHREAVQAKYWWRQARPCPELRALTAKLSRFIVTPRVSKHRVAVWVDAIVVPDCQLVAFARDDDYFFGVVSSRIHNVWALSQGTQVRERESGFRYTPTTCFETFPLPKPTPTQSDAVAAAAKELNALRENWLNPPEWTAARMLEFPGSADGPWRRFVTNPDADGSGTVRYPVTEPRDADCAAKLAKRTLTNLYNERPGWLANAHAKLDTAMAAAYGWPANLGEDEILSRLLALNQERAKKDSEASEKRGTIRNSRGTEAGELL